METMASWSISKARRAAAVAAQKQLDVAVDAEEREILQQIANQQFRMAMHLVDRHASKSFEPVADAQHVVDEGSRAVLAGDSKTLERMFGSFPAADKFTEHLIVTNPSPSEADRKIIELQLEVLMPEFYAKLRKEGDPYEAWAVAAMFHESMFYSFVQGGALLKKDGTPISIAEYSIDATKAPCNPFLVPLTAWGFVKDLLLPHREARKTVIDVATLLTKARMAQAMSALSAKQVRASQQTQSADEARAAGAKRSTRSTPKLVRPKRSPSKQFEVQALSGAAMHGVKPDGTGPG